MYRAPAEHELQPPPPDPDDRFFEFDINSFPVLRGFISGLYAGNYDISHIFIDNLCKVAHSSDEREIGEFLNWLDAFSSPLNLKTTVTISASADSATDTMRKYM